MSMTTPLFLAGHPSSSRRNRFESALDSGCEEQSSSARREEHSEETRQRNRDVVAVRTEVRSRRHAHDGHDHSSSHRRLSCPPPRNRSLPLLHCRLLPLLPPRPPPPGLPPAVLRWLRRCERCSLMHTRPTSATHSLTTSSNLSPAASRIRSQSWAMQPRPIRRRGEGRRGPSACIPRSAMRLRRVEGRGSDGGGDAVDCCRCGADLTVRFVVSSDVASRSSALLSTPLLFVPMGNIFGSDAPPGESSSFPSYVTDEWLRNNPIPLGPAMGPTKSAATAT